jgi:hypothetical protein
MTVRNNGVYASFVLVLALLLPACSSLHSEQKPVPTSRATRAQLSVGYSLLYEESDGIHKLKWLIALKDKPEEMSRVTSELLTYYGQLADSLRKLSKEYPAVHIDATTMSSIEADARKGIGEDMAKDIAPLIGKGGPDFERETLLMFYNGLNEQRHLTEVMLRLETEPGLKKFLETTKTQLDERYAKVGALLSRRYFTH